MSNSNVPVSREREWRDRDAVSYYLYYYKTVDCKNCQAPPSKIKHQHNDKMCDEKGDDMGGRRNPMFCDYGHEICADVNPTQQGIPSAFTDPRSCPQGNSCDKCHTFRERWYHPVVYKAEKCAQYHLHGHTCRNGPRCTRYHDMSEMRDPQESTRLWKKHQAKYKLIEGKVSNHLKRAKIVIFGAKTLTKSAKPSKPSKTSAKPLRPAPLNWASGFKKSTNGHPHAPKTPSPPPQAQPTLLEEYFPKLSTAPPQPLKSASPSPPPHTNGCSPLLQPDSSRPRTYSSIVSPPMSNDKPINQVPSLFLTSPATTDHPSLDSQSFFENQVEHFASVTNSWSWNENAPCPIPPILAEVSPALLEQIPTEAEPLAPTEHMLQTPTERVLSSPEPEPILVQAPDVPLPLSDPMSPMLPTQPVHDAFASNPPISTCIPKHMPPLETVFNNSMILPMELTPRRSPHGSECDCIDCCFISTDPDPSSSLETDVGRAIAASVLGFVDESLERPYLVSPLEALSELPNRSPDPTRSLQIIADHEEVILKKAINEMATRNDGLHQQVLQFDDMKLRKKMDEKFDVEEKQHSHRHTAGLYTERQKLRDALAIQNSTRERLKCQHCRDNERTAILVPCGHAYCQVCSADVDANGICSICTSFVTLIQRMNYNCDYDSISNVA